MNLIYIYIYRIWIDIHKWTYVERSLPNACWMSSLVRKPQPFSGLKDLTSPCGRPARIGNNHNHNNNNNNNNNNIAKVYFWRSKVLESKVNPATWKHGWSKRGFSRIPSNSNMVIINLSAICYSRVSWWYSAKIMFTPNMFSRGWVFTEVAHSVHSGAG